jgi:steroid C-25 hydroxylase gamma subunit
VASITAPKVNVAAGTLLDPDATVWRNARAATLAMEPAPIGYQPSVYVVAAWQNQPYGQLKELQVQAAHNGEQLAVRLEWTEEGPIAKPSDLDVFTDAAGVLFALNGSDTPIESMGTPERPVYAWYWRPTLETPLTALGEGVGTVSRLQNGDLQANGDWRERRWRVVFLRGFSSAHGVRISAPGRLTTSFAVWRGANQERAGIKAFAQSWHEISLEG